MAGAVDAPVFSVAQDVGHRISVWCCTTSEDLAGCGVLREICVCGHAGIGVGKHSCRARGSGDAVVKIGRAIRLGRSASAVELRFGFRIIRFRLTVMQRGDDDRRKNGDDSDDNQELDESESAISFCHSFGFLLHESFVEQHKSENKCDESGESKQAGSRTFFVD